MKLSVVIPVYRVEKSLSQCVESVVKQQCGDMEIILVDDGSPDNSPQICDELAKKYSQIRTVHRTNGGLSAARNTGIRHAQGEYITFVDSDDEVAPNTLRHLITFMEDHDDVDILEYPVDIKGKERLDFKEAIYDNTTRYWKETKAYKHTYACNKVYRRELFREINFPNERIFEDVWTFPLLLKKANKIATTNVGLYQYKENKTGLTAQADGEALTSLLNAYLQCPYPVPLIHLINVQLDVYRLTGQILLKNGIAGDEAESLIDKIKLTLYNKLGINNLCLIHKYLKSLL